MKKKHLILMAILILGFTLQVDAQKKDRAIACFKSNMDCGQCEQDLHEFLKFEKGVKDLKVDHVSNTIFVEYKAKKNDENKLAEAIEKKGYKAEKISMEEYQKMMGLPIKEGQVADQDLKHN